MSQSLLPLQTSVTTRPLRHRQLATWNDCQCLVHTPEGEEYLCCSASLCQFRWLRLIWRAFSAQRGLAISSQIVNHTSSIRYVMRLIVRLPNRQNHPCPICSLWTSFHSFLPVVKSLLHRVEETYVLSLHGSNAFPELSVLNFWGPKVVHGFARNCSRWGCVPDPTGEFRIPQTM